MKKIVIGIVGVIVSLFIIFSVIITRPFDNPEELLDLYYATIERERVTESLDSLPLNLTEVLVYLNDENYYSHNGLKSDMFYAFFYNLIPGSIYDGPSAWLSITQEFTRRIFYPKEYTLVELSQIITTLRINNTFSKRELLYHYMINIPFYTLKVKGVDRAVRKYLNSTGKDELEDRDIVLLCLMSRRYLDDMFNDTYFYVLQDSFYERGLIETKLTEEEIKGFIEESINFLKQI